MTTIIAATIVARSKAAPKRSPSLACTKKKPTSEAIIPAEATRRGISTPDMPG